MSHGNIQEGHTSCPSAKRLGRLAVLLIVLFSISCLLQGCSNAVLKGALPYDPAEAEKLYIAAFERVKGLQTLDEGASSSFVHRIAQSDVLEIKVFENENMSIRTRVDSDGSISFSPLGKIQVKGTTAKSLEDYLKAKLRGSYIPDPHVTVLVDESSALNVMVIGSVNNPGSHPLWGEKRLLDVLGMIGGLTATAGNTAFVTRKPVANETRKDLPRTDLYSLGVPGSNPNAQAIMIRLDKLFLESEAEWNIRIFPGDSITIPSAGYVHVTGPGIKKPGMYPLSFVPKTLTQVLDEAYGLRAGANKTLMLVRKNGDNSNDFMKVDYKEMLKNGEDNVLLRPDDRIVVYAGGPLGKLIGLPSRLSLGLGMAPFTVGLQGGGPGGY